MIPLFAEQEVMIMSWTELITMLTMIAVGTIAIILLVVSGSRCVELYKIWKRPNYNVIMN